MPIHDEINEDRRIYVDTVKIQKYRDYVEGEHVVTLTEKQKAILEGILENEFCDNACGQIVGAAADRLSLERWECPDESVEEFLSELYLRATVEDLQGEAHYSSLRDGDGVIALGWSNNRQIVELTEEQWWNGKEGVFIRYDYSGSPIYAVKEWSDATDYVNTYYRNVFFENRIERYVSSDGAEWVPNPLFQIVDGREILEEWPLPWLKLDGTPLGIPYVHFPNPKPSGGCGSRKQYGRSELAGGVIGFQDQINDLQYAISGAGRLTAFQMVWGTGISVELDSDGNPKIKTGPGQFLGSKSPQARFGYIPAGDLSQLINTLNLKLERMAHMTRTPLHVIKGKEWPSGEAILRAEQPAVGKATRQIAKFKPRWVTVAHRAIEIRNRFSREAALDENPRTAPITAVFASPERRDPVSKSIIVNNIVGTISRQESRRIMGYTQSQAAEIEKEYREEKQWDSQLVIRSQPTQPVGASERESQRRIDSESEVGRD